MYSKEKSDRLINKIMNVLKFSEKEITTINKIDLYNTEKELEINDINFESIAGLRKELNFNNYKLVEKSNKHLKIKAVVPVCGSCVDGHHSDYD
jgi:GTP1/Obg family GTP-binding protein